MTDVRRTENLVWLEPASWEDRRNILRQATRATGFLRPFHGRGSQVNLLDLSTSGCRLQTTMLLPGQKVWIQIGEIAPKVATVAWTYDEEAGLQFRDRLHPTVVDHYAPPSANRRKSA